jgi:hypothetical protein
MIHTERKQGGREAARAESPLWVDSKSPDQGGGPEICGNLSRAL